MSVMITPKLLENEMIDVETIHRCAHLASLAYSLEKAFENESIVVVKRANAKCVIFFNSPIMDIAISGTDDHFDVWSDFEFHRVVEESTDELVHLGFKKEADKLFPSIAAHIVMRGVKQLTLTGHSLGGAICVIIAARLKTLMPQLSCKLVTFGSPRVGSKSFVQKMECRHTRVICRGDPIPHFPPSFCGFKHHGSVLLLKPNSVFRQHSVDTYVKAMSRIL